MSQHIPVPVYNIAPDHPVRIRILSCIIRAPYDIPTLYYLEIYNISHHHEKQGHEKISDPSEFFVPFALFFGLSLVPSARFFSVFPGHCPHFLLSP